MAGSNARQTGNRPWRPEISLPPVEEMGPISADIHSVMCELAAIASLLRQDLAERLRHARITLQGCCMSVHGMEAGVQLAHCVSCANVDARGRVEVRGLGRYAGRGLHGLAGENVLVSPDPADPERLLVHDLDGAYLCDARRMQPLDGDGAAEEVAA